MKRYKKYMDNVKVSDTLHQRLRELKEPKKKPAWTRYGAMAAALVLVFGLGAYGLNYLHTAVGQRMFMAAIEKAEVPQPDIALENPGEADQPGEKTLGSYEYYDPRFEGMGVACFRILPYIDYGTSNENAEQKISMDWAIREGATERELSQQEIIDLLGGQDLVSTHLDWDAYELSGRIWERPDGSPLMVLLGGYQGPLDHFEFSVMDGELPPTCIAYEDSVTQEVRGLTVTADKCDGKDGCSRRVSFMKDDVGYRFDLTATDAQRAEVLVSRLVCQAAEGGLCGAGEAAAAPVSTVTCPVCGETFPAGDEKAHVHSFPGGDATAPAVSADPSYSAPAVSAEPGYTCPTCGETVPAGMTHDCAMCDGYPAPHICEICGEAYPEGTDHQCEVCGYPLAPDTHVCEVCGQALPAGVEHSHQAEHHQEEHHSEHH